MNSFDWNSPTRRKFKTIYAPTKLGRAVSRSGLSPESGAILAGFFEGVDKNLTRKYERLKERRYGDLRRFTDLDLVFLCCACHECRNPLLKIPSKRAIADVKEFVELLAPEEKNRSWASGVMKNHPNIQNADYSAVCVFHLIPKERGMHWSCFINLSNLHYFCISM